MFTEHKVFLRLWKPGSDATCCHNVAALGTTTPGWQYRSQRGSLSILEKEDDYITCSMLVVYVVHLPQEWCWGFL